MTGTATRCDHRLSSSLLTGIAIYELFQALDTDATLGVSDVADSLGLSRSTAHRYLTTLAEAGWLEQGEDSR